MVSRKVGGAPTMWEIAQFVPDWARPPTLSPHFSAHFSENELVVGGFAEKWYIHFAR